jgi:glycosyltransferase involved in cell wall biosynthesis
MLTCLTPCLSSHARLKLPAFLSAPFNASPALRDPSHPAFSVVIPAHNSGVLLKEALESVQSQTLQDFEVIVIDDGSTDNTWEVIQACAKLFPQRFHTIRFTPGQSKGPAGARNAGIRQARGEIVAFLDSDDLWPAGHLARANETLQRSGERTGLFAGPGQILGSNRPSHEFLWPTPEPQPASPQLLKGCYFPLPSVCIRRKLLQQLGGFSEELICYEDWLLYLQLSIKTLFAHSPEPECLVRKREASVTTNGASMSKPMYRDWIRAYLIAEQSGMRSSADLRIMRQWFIQGCAGELADYLCGFDIRRATWSTSGLLASGFRGQKVWRPILWRGFCEFLGRGLCKAGRVLRAK